MRLNMRLDTLTGPYWVALSIGNTHLRWAYFDRQVLQQTWVVPHLSAQVLLAEAQTSPMTWSQACLRSPPLQWHGQQGRDPFPPLIVASVVQTQLNFWQGYPHLRFLSLADIPLCNMYETFGLDRALALWGAGQTYEWPILVIDAGTAMTFTAADQNRCLVGGAILPGLGLQLSMLAEGTDALPIAPPPTSCPPLWAQDTVGAIQAGVVHSLIAMVRQVCQTWRKRFPLGNIVITGGDSDLFLAYLKDCDDFLLDINHNSLALIPSDPTLLFKGMNDICQN